MAPARLLKMAPVLSVKVAAAPVHVAVAALLKEAQRYRGKHIVAVLCGRNIAAEKLRELW